MNDTRERLARDLAHAIRGWRDDDAGDLELAFHLLDAMREVAQEEDDAAKAAIAVVIHDRCAALERRIAALDLVLRRLLSENAHILVGGVAFSEQSLDELDRAQDHGRTEAAHGGSDGRPGAIPGRGAKWMVPPKQTATEVGESQDGALSSVQPAPAPVDLTTQRAYMAHPVAPEPSEEAIAAHPELRIQSGHLFPVDGGSCVLCDLPRLEREAGERMVRRFVSYVITHGVVEVDGKRGVVPIMELLERFLKEGT